MYKVPKEKAVVLVKVPPVAPEWKTLFTSACAETHRGKETVSDVFAADRFFLPLLDEREGIMLVRRAAIRWVRIEEPEKVEYYYYEIRQGAPQAVVRCNFDDGEVLEGTIFAIGPAGEQRVQDIVNREEGFLHLDAASGLFLVNLRHVARITVKEKEHGGP